MSSTKCPNCGMINWATAERCKRCALALAHPVTDGAAHDQASHESTPPPHTDGAWPQDAGGAWSPHADAHAPGSWEQTYNEPPPSYYAPYSHTYPPPRGTANGSRRHGVVAVVTLVAVVSLISFIALPRLRSLGKPQWQLYAPMAESFSVHMPCDAKLTTKPLSTPAGQLQMHVATADLTNDEACVVMYADYPVERLELSYDDLRGIAADVAQENHSRLISDEPSKLGESQGIEFETSPPPDLVSNSRVFGRMYVVGNRLYILMLAGLHDGALVRERANFFDSFRLGRSREH